MPTIAKITMNDDEVAVARILAERRYEKNRAAGVKGYENTTGEPELEKETRSILGEFAFAKMLDVYPPTDQDPSKAGSPDFVLSGKTVDVKTGPGLYCNLQVNVESAKHDRDYYALMLQDGDAFHYMGWASFDEVVSAPIVTENASPYFQVAQSLLYPEAATFKKLLSLE